MRFARPLLACAALAAGALLSTPASAACAGTQQIFYVCVTTPTVTPTTIEQCVYAGGDTCEDVSVPFVGVSGGGEVSCGGGTVNLALCDSLSNLFRPCGPLIACP